MQERKSYKQSFYNKYIEMISRMSKLESVRKELLFKFRIKQSGAILVCVLFVAFIIILYKISSIENFFIVLIALSYLLFLFLFVYFDNLKKYYMKERDEFKKNIKRKFHSEIITCFDYIKKTSAHDIYTNLKQKGVICNQQDEYSIIKTWELDDAFCGNYKGLDFSIVEVMNCLTTGYRKLKRGIIFDIKLNKNIKGKVNVFPKTSKRFTDKFRIKFLYLIIISIYGLWAAISTFITSDDLLVKIFTSPSFLFMTLIGIVGIKYYIAPYFISKEKVNLEDVNFQKKYIVETDNQIEARYLLTPSFIERFNNLKNVFNSKDVRCYAENDSITFIIGTNHDIFEIGDIYHSITDGKQIEQFYKEMTAIIEMIDYFKLDERTGL